MTITHDVRDDTLLPGAAVVVGIRSLLIWAIVAATMLAVFLRGSMSSCSGGVTGSGRFLDADGQPSDVAPMCGSVQMSASPLVYVAIALIVVTSLTRVLGRAATVDQALRIVNNARMVIVVLTLVTFVVGYWAIMTLRVDDWNTYSILIPFPFTTFDVSTHPMGANG
jgi:cytosine/uracil/thiamine/allantoin permease